MVVFNTFHPCKSQFFFNLEQIALKFTYIELSFPIKSCLVIGTILILIVYKSVLRESYNIFTLGVDDESLNRLINILTAKGKWRRLRSSSFIWRIDSNRCFINK